MKTKKQNKNSIDNQLRTLFKDVFTDEDEINEAVKDAKKAFSMVMADAVYRNPFSEEEL